VILCGLEVVSAKTLAGREAWSTATTDGSRRISALAWHVNYRCSQEKHAPLEDVAITRTTAAQTASSSSVAHATRIAPNVAGSSPPPEARERVQRRRPPKPVARDHIADDVSLAAALARIDATACAARPVVALSAVVAVHGHVAHSGIAFHGAVLAAWHVYRSARNICASSPRCSSVCHRPEKVRIGPDARAERAGAG
jgi:hypothetical protein